MSATLFNVTKVRRYCNARGKRMGKDFARLLDLHLQQKLNSACQTHNGGKQTLDGAVAAYVGLVRVLVLIFACFFLSGCVPGMAMDRFEALSQIESGDNDLAVGRAGEISRYQITPAVWVRTVGHLTIYQNGVPHPAPATLSPFRQHDALRVTKWIMGPRLGSFISTHGRYPTDIEFYLLWSCPSRVGHPTKFKAEVAARFANLCEN